MQAQLGIEKSQYYREHARAVEALVTVLAGDARGDVRGDGAAVAGSVAALRGPAAPGALPVPLSSFVGRERELGAVVALLGAHRLVTLTGPGGVGKTRLALRAAADARAAAPDGVWLAELAALADPALVPQAVAAALGVREAPGRPLLATLTDALRPRRLLLVLDNCEHLVDACARLADALLRACPHADASWPPAGRRWASPGRPAYRVPPLSLPATHPAAGGRGADAVRGGAAVRRAGRRRAAGLRRDRPERLGAWPRCAAAWTGSPWRSSWPLLGCGSCSVEQLAARLDDRFRLLTGGSRTALRRQQTLRATVDWSHGLLDAAERGLLRRLAVFAGGWTLEAAEAVCAGDADGAADGDAAGTGARRSPAARAARTCSTCSRAWPTSRS